MIGTRQVFLDSLPSGRAVLTSSRVPEQWDQPSALPQMTIAALSGHLLRALETTVMYLDAPPGSGAPIAPADYYSIVLGDRDLSDPVHAGIRERGLTDASGGHVAVVTRWDAASERLAIELGEQPAGRVVSVRGELSLQLDDYLVTRLVELLVHTDDLACSVDLGTPAFPKKAMDLVLTHLLAIARSRHGDLSALRAFTRRERDPDDALRVF